MDPAFDPSDAFNPHGVRVGDRMIRAMNKEGTIQFGVVPMTTEEYNNMKAAETK
jgi:hypothetical protein